MKRFMLVVMWGKKVIGNSGIQSPLIYDISPESKICSVIIINPASLSANNLNFTTFL